MQKIIPYDRAERNALQDAVLEGGQIQIVIGFFQICTKRVFEKQIAKIKIPYYTANPGTQKVTLPEEAPSHRVIGFLKIFYHFFAAKVPGYLYTHSSVASGPYLPHVKDCAGLE